MSDKSEERVVYSASQTTRTLLVALGADLGTAFAQVGAAVLTGSPAVAATASESVADTANDLFLLLAQRRGGRRADEQHALGYGREAYFWALLAGLGVFFGGAVFSLREGIDELIHPSASSSFAAAYVVLAISASFDLASTRQSAGQMIRRARLFGRKLVTESAVTSDPTLRTVFLSDAVSTAGDLIAVAALAIDQITGSSVPQAVAAVLIGVALIGVGLRLVRGSHDFLVGTWLAAAEAPPAPARFTRPFVSTWEEQAKAFVLGYAGVAGVRELLATFVGPSQVWIVARVEIDDRLTGEQVASLVGGIEAGMKRLEYIYRVDVVPIGAAHPDDTTSSSARRSTVRTGRPQDPPRGRPEA